MDYFEMYRDIWTLHKGNIDMVDGSEQFWNGLIAEAGALSAKYGDCPFITALIVAELDEMERVYRGLAK